MAVVYNRQTHMQNKSHNSYNLYHHVKKNVTEAGCMSLTEHCPDGRSGNRSKNVPDYYYW